MTALPSQLAGRHALVTGGSRGIGAAIARRLSADGATVTILGRNAGRLAAIEAELGCRTVVCDLTDANEIARDLIGLMEGDDAPDILINNAGHAITAPFSQTSDRLLRDMMILNFEAVFTLTRMALPAMVARGHGRIINVSSTAGLKGYAYAAAYCAAKHAVIGVTRAVAQEIATKGITINAVCPGFTETDLVTDAVDAIAQKTGRGSADALGRFTQVNPQGRLVQPREVASAVAYLVSDDAAAINGTVLSIAGGEAGT